MVQTRSATSSPVKKPVTKPTVTTIEQNNLPPTGPALHLLIAPQSLSDGARLIPLINPATDSAQSFLFCPLKGLLELKKIARPSHELKSVLFGPIDVQQSVVDKPDAFVSNGYINKQAEYTTATPYDLCFLLLPVALQCAKSDLLQSVEDMLDTIDANKEMRYIYSHNRVMVEDAMDRICDSVEVGDDKMFRYSQQKTLRLLIQKARKACEHGLPPSLEDKYVSRTLEVPVLSIRREESSVSLAESDKENIALAPSEKFESFESKAEINGAEVSVAISQTMTVTMAVAEEKISPAIRDLQRLRTAFKFILHAYCSPTFARSMEQASSESSSDIDFTPLDSHLSHVQKLRAEVIASQSMSNFTQKRRNIEDDEDDEIRAEKKRKMEDEERKKKFLQSRGVRELSKVDVKGMKKMSDFFTKKAVTIIKTKK